MSQPIIAKPLNPGAPRNILRRLSAGGASHDFDVISDSPPPRQLVAQETQEPARAAPASAPAGAAAE